MDSRCSSSSLVFVCVCMCVCVRACVPACLSVCLSVIVCAYMCAFECVSARACACAWPWIFCVTLFCCCRCCCWRICFPYEVVWNYVKREEFEGHVRWETVALSSGQMFATVSLSTSQLLFPFPLCWLSLVLPFCASESRNTSIWPVPGEILTTSGRRQRSWRRCCWSCRVPDRWGKITRRCWCIDDWWRNHRRRFGWCSGQRWEMRSGWRWWTQSPASWPGPSDVTC